MARYGFAAPSPTRISTRVAAPRSGGTRTNVERLSHPQLAWVGASESGWMRRYALTVGLRMS